MADTPAPDGAFPREDLYRAVYPGVEVRDDSSSGMPTLFGHFAVFNTPTEINSAFEGRFIERISPGAFKKTLRENRDKIRVLFQHGKDPQIGDKPLGPLEAAREDETGAAYSVPLLDTAYNRELLPGLKAGLYGSSFRFQVMKEEVDQNPKRSASNPDRLPERTITEAKVLEFGPVTFPAYEGATAGVRSMTDRFHDVEITPTAVDDERIRRTIDNQDLVALDPTQPEDDPTVPEDEPQRTHLTKVSRTGAPIDLYPNREETPSWRL